MAEHYLKEDLYRRVQESDEIFEFLQAGSLDGIWFWDMERPENEWLSPRFKELFGYADHEMANSPEWWQTHIHPDDLKVWMERFEAHKRGETPFVEGVVRYPHKDGSTVWVNCRGVIIRDDQGKPIRMLGAHVDMTRQMQALEYAENIVDTVREPLVVLDADQKVRSLNRAFCRIFGVSPGEAEGQLFSELGNRQWDIPELKDLLKDVLPKNSKVVDFEVEHDFERIGRRTMMLNARKIYRPGNNTQLVLLAIEDITERTRAQEALRKSHQLLRGQYEAVVRASGQLLYDWDPRTDTVSYSNIEALGYSEDEMVGGLAHRADLVHPEDREKFLAEIDHALEVKRPFSLEYRVRKKDGAYIPVEDQGQFFFNESGGVVRIVGFVTDVSEKKHLEDQLRQAQKMEAIGRLAGGIAHDFNNLLSVILGYSEIALDGLPTGDPLRSEITQIRDAGKRATSLTRQLLAFSRRQVLDPEVLDLNEIVKRMDTMLQRLIGEDVDLATRLSPGLDFVRCDPGQVEQIVMNLAVNARDAMPHGGKLTIETANVELDAAYARTHPDVQPGPHVMIGISDTGIAMDEETKAKIFDPFFTTKELGRGTGLGLSTVYGIVKQSGGSIWVYSELGKGTVFKVYLPSADGASVPTERRPTATGPATGTETILVVEDEEGVRGLIRNVLEKNGYTVLDAGDGEQALRLCKQHAGAIHMVLTDVVLPKMDGRQLAEKLVALRPDLKVLYMSGYTDNAIVHHGVLAPGTAFLEKPIRLEKLLEKVREVLAGGSEEPPSE